MPRLPPALEPLFPAVKRAHRATTRLSGAVTRRWAEAHPGTRSLPTRGTYTSLDTAHLEPETARVHPGGPAERVVRPMPVGIPPAHAYFAERLVTDVPHRFTLEITDGLVVGDYSAHITPGGILDYETSYYFGVFDWREHPVFLRPRLPEPVHVDGTLLSLATRGTWGNYYHVLMDLLPRWGILQESMPGVVPDAVYVNTNTRYVRELLAMTGLDRFPALEAGRDAAYRADRLLVPNLPNYGNIGPPWTVRWLRDNLPWRRRSDLPKRLYITRGQARNTRRLVNEAEVLDILHPLGFVAFDPGQHPVQEQLDHFASAEIVVAVHGAGNVNLVFAQPGVRVLELFAPRYVDSGYWTILNNIPEAKYRYLVGVPEDTRPPGSPMNRVMEDITVDLEQFRASLDDLLS